MVKIFSCIHIPISVNIPQVFTRARPREGRNGQLWLRDTWLGPLGLLVLTLPLSPSHQDRCQVLYGCFQMANAATNKLFRQETTHTETVTQGTTSVSPGLSYHPPHSLTIFCSGFSPQLILGSSLSLSTLDGQQTGSKAQNISQSPGESLLKDVSATGRPRDDTLHPFLTASQSTTPSIRCGGPRKGTELVGGTRQ